MTVIATCAPNCCVSEPCSFLADLQEHSMAVVVPAGALIDTMTQCLGCDERNGQTYRVCECTEPSSSDEWYAIATIYNLETCFPSAAGVYFVIRVLVFCEGTTVTVRVSLSVRSPSLLDWNDGGSTSWRCDYGGVIDGNVYELITTEDDFTDFVDGLVSELEIPHKTPGGEGRCNSDPTKPVKIRLRPLCSVSPPSTTTTTTPDPWLCAQEFPNAQSEGDCSIETQCVQRTLLDCLGDINCQYCDGPFDSEEECLASLYCAPPTTTTTTTTTTPPPFWCCAEDLEFCGTANTCIQGPECPEYLPFECSGPYETSEECNAACVNTTTTTTPECDSTDANNPCTEFGCYMLCEGGTYTAPQNLIGPAICECNPSPEDIALIGQPCTGAHITARCNSCNNAVTNQCPTTPEP